MADNQNQNSMQSHMGVAADTMPSAQMVATQPPPMVASPGMASMQAMQQSRMMQMMATPQAALTPQMQMAAMGGFNGSAGMYNAQLYAGALGMQGNMQGMMAQPFTQTPANMGIYRPWQQLPVMGAPQMGAGYPTPVVQTPFAVGRQPSMFQSPFEYQYQAGQTSANQLLSMGVGAAGAAGTALFGAQSPNRDVFTKMLNPFIEARERGMQLQLASQQFVVGGTQLNPMGRGLNMNAATQLGRGIESMAFNPQFQAQTGGKFVAQDLMRITNMAAKTGMLDFEQDSTQIIGQVRKVSRSLSKFMELANEPDVVNAMRQMGQMRNMGMSLPEITNVVQEGRMYARMAGMTREQLIQTGGLPGAQLFQQMGLSAGTGYRAGMGAMGIARAGIAGGAFDERTLAMAGGQQGIAQTMLMGQARMMANPLMAAAGGMYGAGGFSAQSGGIGGLGGLGGAGLTATALNNMNKAIREGGPGAMMEFMAQQNRVADRIARDTSPAKLFMSQVQQAQAFGGVMGGSKKQQMLAGFMMQGYSPEEAQTMVDMSTSAGTYEVMRQQSQAQIADIRAQRFAETRRSVLPMHERISRSGIFGSEFVGGLLRKSQETGERTKGAAAYWTGRLGEYGEQQAAAGIGQLRVNAGPGAGIASQEELNRVIASTAGSGALTEGVGLKQGPGGTLDLKSAGAKQGLKVLRQEWMQQAGYKQGILGELQMRISGGGAGPTPQELVEWGQSRVAMSAVATSAINLDTKKRKASYDRLKSIAKDPKAVDRFRAVATQRVKDAIQQKLNKPGGNRELTKKELRDILKSAALTEGVMPPGKDMDEELYSRLETAVTSEVYEVGTDEVRKSIENLEAAGGTGDIVSGMQTFEQLSKLEGDLADSLMKTGLITDKDRVGKIRGALKIGVAGGDIKSEVLDRLRGTVAALGDVTAEEKEYAGLFARETTAGEKLTTDEKERLLSLKDKLGDRAGKVAETVRGLSSEQQKTLGDISRTGSMKFFGDTEKGIMARERAISEGGLGRIFGGTGLGGGSAIEALKTADVDKLQKIVSGSSAVRDKLKGVSGGSDLLAAIQKGDKKAIEAAVMKIGGLGSGALNVGGTTGGAAEEEQRAAIADATQAQQNFVDGASKLVIGANALAEWADRQGLTESKERNAPQSGSVGGGS